MDTESVNINFDIYKQPVYTQLTVRIKVLSNLQGSIILQEATTKKSVENNFYNIANKIFIDSTTVSLRFICFLGNFFRFSRFQNFKTITIENYKHFAFTVFSQFTKQLLSNLEGLTLVAYTKSVYQRTQA